MQRIILNKSEYKENQNMVEPAFGRKKMVKIASFGTEK